MIWNTGVERNWVEIQTFIPRGQHVLTNMVACPAVDQHCPCADVTWWNLMNKLFKLCLENTKMFTGQKIGRMVFIYFYFDKIFTHAKRNWQDARECAQKWSPHNFLAWTSLVFNKNVLQAATHETRLQMIKIEQKHYMTSCTWDRGCPAKSIIDHRTWSIIGHSTIVKTKLVSRR